MIPIDTLKPAFEALNECDAALQKLDSTCCKPERNIRLKALAHTLVEARAGFDRVGDDPGAGDAVSVHLEDAGAQIGRLHVGCCAPNRLPLYTRMLGGLTTAQRTLDHALDRGH